LDEENRDKLLTVGKKLLEIKRLVSNTENKIDIPEGQNKVEKL
jgi:hypothetical protein